METLAPAQVLSLFDGIACGLLAAAATCRARTQGAHFTGAVILGCLCGLVGPLLREAFGHGQPSQIASEMPAVALTGSLGAICALYLLKTSRLFFWLDSASIGMAASAGCLLSLPGLGITGAISLGLVNALAPGLVRDMALGDTAMLVDQDWYATAAALGCLIALGVFISLLAMSTTVWLDRHSEEIAALAGFFAVIALRAWKGRAASC